MNARLFAPLVALAVAPFAFGADEENPYKKAKVGDYATYKMTTKVGGFNVEGTLTQTVTAKDDKEATIKVTVKANGMELPSQEQKIDLTKPFDPAKVGNNLPPGAQIEKLKDGTEKLKVGGKEYETKWETYKMKLNAMGMAFEADMKVWQTKDLALPMVKMEMTAEVMNQKMEMVMELESSGSGKEPEKGKDSPGKTATKKDPEKK
jgi:predicted TIM-barrel fold metal-dependent hydrolase